MKPKNPIDRYNLFPTPIWRASMIDPLMKEGISLEDLEKGAIKKRSSLFMSIRAHPEILQIISQNNIQLRI